MGQLKERLKDLIITMTPKANAEKEKKSDFQLPDIVGRPLKILIVEDENQIARLIELELSYEGYQVDIAKTGKEALEKVEKYKPDLVILDWVLPEMDGL